jgi:hypothetical protein
LAQAYAERNSIITPSSWKTNQKASSDWLTGFLKRNAKLSIRKREATSQARAAGFNQPVVSLFYDNLRNVYATYNFPTHLIYNCDETNVPTVMPPPEAIAVKGLKQVGCLRL